jgi:choline dehydrogenase-like flavoprotein
METAVGPVVDPVHSDDRLPERTSVVVVGGGIAGSSTALYLAEKGVSVVLCEKGHIAGEQSSRNWGWVTARGRDMRELPLCLESARLWKGMNEFLGTETGYRRLGSLRVYDTEENLAIGEEWLKEAQLLQIQAKFLQRGEIEELAPGASIQFSTPQTTAAPNRRRLPQLLQKAPGGAAPRSSHNAPSAVSISRPERLPASSRNAAASPAMPSCLRAADGRPSFAAT